MSSSEEMVPVID